MKVITTNLLNRFWENGVAPMKEQLKNKLETSKIIASTSISEAGKVMDGKTASEEFAKLNGGLDNIIDSLQFSVSAEINTGEKWIMDNPFIAKLM